MQSLARAFHILSIIAAKPDGVSFSAIARASGLPQGTVGRLLSALDGLGAVERLPAAKGYRIGDGLIALGAGVALERQLKVMARPHLLELAEATAETVNLVICSGHQALFIDQIDSPFELRTQDYTNRRYPLHVVSSGKVFLAHFSDEQLRTYLQTPLVAYTDQTVTNPKTLRGQLPDIRAQSYVETVDEAEAGLSTYAAPVFVRREDETKVIAAVSVTAPSFRVASQVKKSYILQQLKACAQALSALLLPPYSQGTELV